MDVHEDTRVKPLWQPVQHVLLLGRPLYIHEAEEIRTQRPQFLLFQIDTKFRVTIVAIAVGDFLATEPTQSTID